MSSPPVFAASDKPPAIVAAAGEWLANALGGGFIYVRSTREVVHKTAPRTESIHLQTSSLSRAGEATTVMPRLTVTDSRVRDWQRGRPLTGLFASGGYTFNSMLINLGIRNVELFGPLRKQHPDLYLTLAEFLGALRSEVMPNLLAMRDGPAAAAERLPVKWIVFPEPPFWWATAYGELAAAKRILGRYFEANPASRVDFEKGRGLALLDAEPPFSNTLVAFGWSAVRSEALGAQEPV